MKRGYKLLIVATIVLCIMLGMKLYCDYEARQEQAYLLAAIEHILSDESFHFQLNESSDGSYDTTSSYHLPDMGPEVRQGLADLRQLLCLFVEEGSLVVDRTHGYYSGGTFIEIFASDHSYLSAHPGYAHLFTGSNASGFGANCRLEWKAALLAQEKIEHVRGLLGLD